MLDTLAPRFEAKVDRSPGLGPCGDCHLWTASLNEHGYGKISIVRGRWIRAHRVAWFLETGEWPSLHVLHRCDTPACVRFEHLFLGTDADNLRDMAAKGRSTRGVRQHMARLTPEAVQEMRSSSLSHVEWARRLGVSTSTVSDARTGRTWAWLR